VRHRRASGRAGGTERRGERGSGSRKRRSSCAGVQGDGVQGYGVQDDGVQAGHARCGRSCSAAAEGGYGAASQKERRQSEGDGRA
jgi:hypothetical protein